MLVQVHKRVRRGWETREIEVSPAECKRVRAATVALLESRKINKPGGCGCYARTMNPDRTCHFCALHIGEEITGSCSGTLTELFAAGIDINKPRLTYV